MPIATKKIILQTALLLFAAVTVSLFAFSNAWASGPYFIDFSYFFIFLCLTLFIFLPATALYLIRRSISNVLGMLFRGAAYLSAAVALFFLLANILVYLDYGYLAYQTFSDEYAVAARLGGLLATLLYFSLAVLFYLAARINKSLDGGKFSLVSQKGKEHARISLAAFSILISLAASLYLWRRASWWASTLETAGWFDNPELTRLAIRDTYDLAFKKIFFIVGFIFASAFLLLKALPSRHTAPGKIKEG